MAFALHYQFAFQQAYPVQGSTPPRYRVSFWRDGYTGEPIELLPGGSPLKIELADGSDNEFQAIQPQKYTISLACQDYWEAKTFYVNTDRELKVIIEIDETGTGDHYVLLRQGWVQNADFSEDYGSKPYYVEVTAACGLATLKDRPLISELGKRLINQISLAHALQTALYHTDLTTDMVTAVNMFENADVGPGQTVNNLAIPTKDPLWQTLVPVDIFTKENNELLSCHEAIELICQSMRCRIIQHLGTWWVVAVPEIAGGFDPWNGTPSLTVQTRWYDNTVLGEAPNNAKNHSLSLHKAASKTGDLRVKADDPKTILLAHDDGIRIEQAFGRYVSKIPNGDFSQADSTGLPIGWKVNNIVPERRFRAGNGTEADPYRLVIRGLTDEKINDQTPYVYTRLEYLNASKEYTKFNHRTLKGRFRLQNLHAAKLWAIAVRDDGDYLFVKGDWAPINKNSKAQSVGTLIPNVSVINGRDVPKPGWCDINIDLGTIDRVKSLIICLGMGEALNAYDGSGHITGPNIGPPDPLIEYADIRMEVAQEGLNLDGIQRTIVQPGKTVKDTTLSLVIGDVPDMANPVDRIGTFFKRANYPNLVPTTRWVKPDQIVLSDGTFANGGKGLPMIDIIAQDYARQRLYAVPTFEGELVGQMPYGPLTAFHIDDLPELGTAVITRWSWLPKEAFHSITAKKLMLDIAEDDIPDSKHQWQTPDGVIDVVSDQDGSPIEPTFTGPLSERQKELIALIKANLGNQPTIGKLLPGFTPLGNVPAGSVPSLTVLGNGRPLKFVQPLWRKQITFPIPR